MLITINMFKVRDSKHLPQFIQNLKNYSNENDDFIQDNVEDSLKLFESLQNYEKSIDKILAKKRMEIQENFTYYPEQVTSCLRIYFQTQIVASEEDKRSLEIAIFGKLLPNKESTNSLIDNEELGKHKEFKNSNFLDMVKYIKIHIPSVDTIEYYMADYKKISMKSDPIEKDGFLIKRDLAPEIALPLTCSVSIELDSYSKKYKLSRKAAELMRKDYAARSEVLDAIKMYIYENNLAKDNVVYLTPILRGLFDISDRSQECIFLHEISPFSRQLFESELLYDCDITLSTEDKSTKAVDILIELQLDEIRECMVFFVQKLLFDEKEKDRILDDYNILISSNEKLKQIEKLLLKSFENLYQQILKRKNYLDFNENISGFLKNFVETQNNLIKTIRSNTNSVLQKRNWNDENDFVENLLRNYEDVLETEIKNYFDENMIVEAKKEE